MGVAIFTSMTMYLIGHIGFTKSLEKHAKFVFLLQRFKQAREYTLKRMESLYINLLAALTSPGKF